MRFCKPIVFVFLSVILGGCGRSPDTHFYVLTPLPFHQHQTHHALPILIGIDEIHMPHYLSKPQFMIHTTKNRVELKELDQWAEGLDKNVRMVIEANLTTLLPKAVVTSRPWNVYFKPHYQLQIDIQEFDVDQQGNSVLRADYRIYKGDVLSRNGTLQYHEKISPATVDTLVVSMNANLAHLTHDLARQLSSGKPWPS